MQLPIIPAPANDAPDNAPWYQDGLRFTCTQCGNCCTGSPGYVWISDEEIDRLAAHLKLTPREVVARYCRRVNGRITLKENKTPDGNYDCIFLVEPALAASDTTVASATSRRKICSIYSVRPLQCRTWPFWEENLLEKPRWNRAAKRCHGMNQGRLFTKAELETIRDARDWPDKPPTSTSTAEGPK